MAIRVLLFAQLKDRVGAHELLAPFPQGSTGHGLMQWLTQQHPSVAGLLAVSRLAVNGEYAPLDQALRDRDEVAVIPPVSGG
jgi:molybdopterin converting factor subunit 1